ncbi:MAG: thiamine pyrophosphate-dependent enzyme, partial [Spirochaetaceae bacterium]
MEKLLLSGNEAIARGAWEAGCRVGTGYPGTPSTEILESLTEYEGVSTEWSVNEKVALEVGIGAALAGARTLVTMKHVGVNVAADPLFTGSYIGVKGGLVVVTADDPSMHSSQNEQDNRNYAYHAKLPMLEPSDSQEAKEFTKLAFEISENYDTPVLLRSTTRISHSQTVVTPESRVELPPPGGFERNIRKYVMIPAYARPRHVEVEKRLRRITKDANDLAVNRMEPGDPEIGFVTAGIAYTYVRELYPNASVLKLGMVHPMPEELIREFASRVGRLIVVEELDPFFELRMKAWGLQVEGKEYVPVLGELSADRIREALEKAGVHSAKTQQAGLSHGLRLPPRPPALCPGCPHRAVFEKLHENDLKVTGDIGCYTLGALPPFNAMDTCVDMGASVTVAQGIEIAEGEGHKRDTVAVIGDSTFAHSGIAGLINAAYNGRHGLVIVLDNGTTAMTGMQPNPFSGERIDHSESFKLDYEKLAAAVGIGAENYRMVNAYKPDEIEAAINELRTRSGMSLLVVKGTCVILKQKMKKRRAA